MEEDDDEEEEEKEEEEEEEKEEKDGDDDRLFQVTCTQLSLCLRYSGTGVADTLEVPHHLSRHHLHHRFPPHDHRCHNHFPAHDHHDHQAGHQGEARVDFS